jgi:hypothetical protein
MPEISLGVVITVLIPGLLIYCALYSIFSSNDAGGQEPPDGKSVKALTIVLLGAGAVHMVTAVLIAIGYGIADKTGFALSLPGDKGGYYETLLHATNHKAVTPGTLAYLLVATTAQGIAAYWAVRAYLNHLARCEKLPVWLYGWTAPLANHYDNDNSIVLGQVLTDIDIAGMAVVYVGAVRYMTISGGSVQQLTLIEAERYCLNLSQMIDVQTIRPMAKFQSIVLDHAHIRNIAFSVLRLDSDPPSPTNDPALA